MLLCPTAYAAGRSGVEHYVGLSVAAGEANVLAKSDLYPELKTQAGADAQFGVSYELRKNRFFFNIGAQAQFLYTGVKIGSFTDQLPDITDHDGETYTHQYVYSNYRENQKTLLIGIPVQLGVFLTDKVYLALGVKANLPLLADYSTRSTLETNGLYPASYYWIDPLANDPTYGFYSPDTYRASGTYEKSGRVWNVVPNIEVGGLIPLTKKVRLRVGAYVEYALPIGLKREQQLTDYASVNEHYGSTSLPFSKQDLFSNLRVTSVLDNAKLNRDWSRISFGVKLTVLFVLKQKPVCTTCVDDSGLDYIQPKQSRNGKRGRSRVLGYWK